MTRRKRFERVVDLLLVSGADSAIVHDIVKAKAFLRSTERYFGPADIEKVRTQTANEPFEKDLKHSGRDQAVQQSDDGIVDVPEGAYADLHEQDDCDGH